MHFIPSKISFLYLKTVRKIIEFYHKMQSPLSKAKCVPRELNASRTLTCGKFNGAISPNGCCNSPASACIHPCECNTHSRMPYITDARRAQCKMHLSVCRWECWLACWERGDTTLCTRPLCGGAHTNTYVHVRTEAIYNYYGNHCNVHNDNKCPLRSLHINLAPHK